MKHFPFDAQDFRSITERIRPREEIVRLLQESIPADEEPRRPKHLAREAWRGKRKKGRS